MGITFHCEHCGKKIEAPDNAGGKWGKCPGCKNKVYVPSQEPAEELRLAPLDTEEERRQQALKAETIRLRKDILSETAVPEEGAQPKPTPAAKPEALSDAELTISVIAYIRQMADGELEEAERTAKSIIPEGARVGKILQRILTSETPEPELADIPQQVLSGLIKNLRGRLR